MTRASPPRASSAVQLVPVAAAMHPVVAELHRRCFEDHWNAYTVGQVMRMAGAFGYIAVRRSDDEAIPVGFALASGAIDEWELLSLGVLPEHRRGGIARMLVQAVIDEATARGADKLFLEVAEDNMAARKLYAAFGFMPIGRRPGYYKRRHGPAIAALTLRRSLRTDLAG